MTIEICLSVYIHKWRKFIFNSTKAVVTGLIVITAAFASTFYVVFASSFTTALISSSENVTTTKSECSLNYLFYLQKQVNKTYSIYLDIKTKFI